MLKNVVIPASIKGSRSFKMVHSLEKFVVTSKGELIVCERENEQKVGSTLTQYNLKTWKTVLSKPIAKYTYQVEILPDDRLLTLHGNPDHILVWDVDKEKTSIICDTNSTSINSFKVMSNSLIVTYHDAKNDVCLRFWDIQSNKCIHSCHVAKLPGKTIASQIKELKTLSGDRVVSFNDDASIHLADLKITQTSVVCQKVVLDAYDFLSNQNLVVGHEDNHIRVWNLDTKLCITEINVKQFEAGRNWWGVGFDKIKAISDELVLITNLHSQNGKLRLLNIKSAKLLFSVDPFVDESVEVLPFQNTPFFLVHKAYCYSHNKLELWEITSDFKLVRRETLYDNQDYPFIDIMLLSGNRVAIIKEKNDYKDDEVIEINAVKKYMDTSVIADDKSAATAVKPTSLTVTMGVVDSKTQVVDVKKTDDGKKPVVDVKTSVIDVKVSSVPRVSVYDPPPPFDETMPPNVVKYPFDPSEPPPPFDSEASDAKLLSTASPMPYAISGLTPVFPVQVVQYVTPVVPIQLLPVSAMVSKVIVAPPSQNPAVSVHSLFKNPQVTRSYDSKDLDRLPHLLHVYINQKNNNPRKQDVEKLLKNKQMTSSNLEDQIQFLIQEHNQRRAEEIKKITSFPSAISAKKPENMHELIRSWLFCKEINDLLNKYQLIVKEENHQLKLEMLSKKLVL